MRVERLHLCPLDLRMIDAIDRTVQQHPPAHGCCQGLFQDAMHVVHSPWWLDLTKLLFKEFCDGHLGGFQVGALHKLCDEARALVLRLSLSPAK